MEGKITRHIGVFILNVLKPAIEELDKLLGKCEHLQLDKYDMIEFLEAFFKFETVKLFIRCITLLSLFYIGCYFFTR